MYKCDIAIQAISVSWGAGSDIFPCTGGDFIPEAFMPEFRSAVIGGTHHGFQFITD